MSARRTARKMTSTGRVTKNSVSMTKRGLGSVRGGLRAKEEALVVGREPATDAWRDVDRRETRMEPTLPGSPTRI